MATNLPPWALNAIDKIRRAFLWRGRKEAKGGHCLIAWPIVCRSRELGGLGIVDLKALSQGRRQGYSPVCHGIPKIFETNTNTYMYTYNGITCIVARCCKSSPKPNKKHRLSAHQSKKRASHFLAAARIAPISSGGSEERRR